jgi:transposase-like protein
LQALIEDELTARIGAAGHERTATHTNRRKGPARRQRSMAAWSEASVLGGTTG